MTHHIAVTWPAETIAVITFSDPVRRNEISWAAVDELGTTLAACRGKGARVVVLASALPGHWLQHAWLQDLSNGVEGLPLTGTGAGWFEVLKEVGHEQVVSIAAISGDCSGGGAEIGWACDLRIAERQARFAQPEVNLGLTTGIGGSSRLARLAGRALATEMVLTGSPVTADRLYQLGAINRVVGRGEALGSAIELARQLAGKSAAALQGLKQILELNDRSSLPDAMAHEQAVFQSVVQTDEARTTMKAAQARYDAGESVAQLNNYDNEQER